MNMDVEKHLDNLNPIQQIQLRERISKSYELAEYLNWCEPESDFDIHKRTVSTEQKNKPQEKIVPIISADFEDHESAQSAYTQLQRDANRIDISVYDVHYDKENMSIAVVLEPFEI